MEGGREIGRGGERGVKEEAREGGWSEKGREREGGRCGVR